MMINDGCFYDGCFYGWLVVSKNWKDPPMLFDWVNLGKSTISTGPWLQVRKL